MNLETTRIKKRENNSTKVDEVVEEKRKKLHFTLSLLLKWRIESWIIRNFKKFLIEWRWVIRYVALYCNPLNIEYSRCSCGRSVGIEVRFDEKKRGEDGAMCRGEGVERTESGSGTESYHLEGPSDGNCTVERRDAGVCVPSAYIYIYIFTVGRIYTRTRSRFYNIIFTCAREIYSGKMCVEALSTPQSNSTEKDILVFAIPSLSSASEMRKPGPLSALSSLLLV